MFRFNWLSSMAMKMKIFLGINLEDNPTCVVAVELLCSISKWEIVGCGT